MLNHPFSPSIPNTMKPPSRQSTLSDSSSIVIVGYGPHGPPQYNQNNESSSEVGDASANGGSGSSSSIFLSERGADTDTDMAMDMDVDIDIVPGYQPDHTPPSNISTETPGTDDTATVTDHFGHAFLSNNTAANNNPIAPAPSAHPRLTYDNMAAHQRELEQFHAGGVSGWVDGAGMGLSRRLAAYQGSVACSSLLTTAGGHAHSRGGSGESSFGGAGAGGDWMVVLPPMVADEEVAAAGAWCGEVGVGRL